MTYSIVNFAGKSIIMARGIMIGKMRRHSECGIKKEGYNDYRKILRQVRDRKQKAGSNYWGQKTMPKL
jgi:hypothetical protein